MKLSDFKPELKSETAIHVTIKFDKKEWALVEKLANRVGFKNQGKGARKTGISVFCRQVLLKAIAELEC